MPFSRSGEGFTLGEAVKYYDLADEVLSELDAAHKKFPDQTLPWHDGEEIETRQFARDFARQLNDKYADTGGLTWTLVIREEFLEAVAEVDWAKARAELVQLAAMCFRTVIDMDRKVCHACGTVGELFENPNTGNYVCRDSAACADRFGPELEG